MANFIQKLLVKLAPPAVVDKKTSSLFSYNRNDKTSSYARRRSIKAYKDVLSDEEIASAFDTRLDALIATRWQIFGGASEDFNLFIYNQLKKNLYWMLTYSFNAVPFGKSAIQVVYRQPDQFTDNKITILKVIDENADNFILEDGVWMLNKNPIQTGKYFITANKPSHEWPEGFPLTERLLDVYQGRCDGLDFNMKYLEKFGMPFFSMTLGDGATDEDRAAAETFLDSPRPRGVILPKDSTLETVDGKSTSQNVFAEFDSRTQGQVMRLILGQTLTTSSGDVGSYALGQVHERVAWNKTYSDCIMVTPTIQNLIYTLCALNGVAPQDAPTFEFVQPSGVLQEVATRDLTLSQIGVTFTKEYFVDQYDFDEDQIDYSPAAKQIPGQTGGNFKVQKLSSNNSRLMNRGKFLSPEKFKARIAEAEKLEKKYADQAVNFGKDIDRILKDSSSPKELVSKLKTFLHEGTKEFDERLTEALLRSSVSGAKDAGDE